MDHCKPREHLVEVRPHPVGSTPTKTCFFAWAHGQADLETCATILPNAATSIILFSDTLLQQLCEALGGQSSQEPRQDSRSTWI